MSVKHITSAQNPTIKLVRALEQRKERKETGLFAAEGIKVVATARDLGWQPKIFIFGTPENQPEIFQDLLDWAENAGAECLAVSDDILSRLSTKDNPQSVIAIFEQRWQKSPPASGLSVALEEVRDPGNLGTIVRTLDAVGGGGVLLIDNCCDPYAREAVRASMGSVFAVRFTKVSRGEFLSFAKGYRGEIVGTHLTATTVDFRRDYKKDTLLLMGSEGPGLSEELAATATALVKIPMTSKTADSLNLAAATALMLYEIRRAGL